MNSGESTRSKSAVPMATSAPGRQMKLRPKISGCSVWTKTPTRHSGKPACTRRSQVSAIIWGGLAADLAPSISQSVIFCRSGHVHDVAFAAQVPETSRRHKAAVRVPADKRREPCPRDRSRPESCTHDNRHIAGLASHRGLHGHLDVLTQHIQKLHQPADGHRHRPATHQRGDLRLRGAEQFRRFSLRNPTFPEQLCMFPR